MGHNINTFSELKAEREKMQQEAKDGLAKAKNSLSSVRKEGKSVLVNKVLIPAGIAVVAGYGLKKLVDYIQSEDNVATDSVPPGVSAAAPQATQRASSGNGFLSGINWPRLAVQLVPFIISVGKKMYEEGQLPYFDPPEQEG